MKRWVLIAVILAAALAALAIPALAPEHRAADDPAASHWFGP
jgi:hypothetical protein